MGGLVWVIQGQCHHRVLRKERGRQEDQSQRRGDDKRAQTAVMDGFGDGRGNSAKEGRKLLEAGKGEELVFP
jgi:hypothetical protein